MTVVVTEHLLTAGPGVQGCSFEPGLGRACRSGLPGSVTGLADRHRRRGLGGDDLPRLQLADRSAGPVLTWAPLPTIDLNSDLGEGFGHWSLGDDDALLGVVTSANVACGFHAGDASIMRARLPQRGRARRRDRRPGRLPRPARLRAPLHRHRARGADPGRDLPGRRPRGVRPGRRVAGAATSSRTAPSTTRSCTTRSRRPRSSRRSSTTTRRCRCSACPGSAWLRLAEEAGLHDRHRGLRRPRLHARGHPGLAAAAGGGAPRRRGDRPALRRDGHGRADQRRRRRLAARCSADSICVHGDTAGRRRDRPPGPGRARPAPGSPSPRSSPDARPAQRHDGAAGRARRPRRGAGALRRARRRPARRAWSTSSPRRAPCCWSPTRRVTSLSSVEDGGPVGRGRARTSRDRGELVEIPVTYDGEDLDEAAQLLGCDADELVRRHTRAEWTVAFCGFVPGLRLPHLARSGRSRSRAGRPRAPRCRPARWRWPASSAASTPGSPRVAGS